MTDEITVIPTTNFPAWKRFAISSARAFGVGFLIQFATGLATIQEISDITGKFFLGLFFGAVSAGLYALAKFIQEKRAGMI